MNTSDQFVKGLATRLGIRGLIYLGIPLAMLFLYLFLSLFQGSGGGLPSVYGKRSGREATSSVNGTRVFAEMFVRSGRKVRTITRLSPGINDRADVIVWIPDSFEPPDKKQREFLEAWLAKGNNRRLIYIGRDFDSSGEYFREIAPQLTPEQAVTFKRYEAEAKADFDASRWQMPKEQYARWFTARRDGTRHVAKNLEGDWSEGIDSSKTNILVEGRLDPPVEKDRASAPSYTTTTPAPATAPAGAPPAKTKPKTKANPWLPIPTTTVTTIDNPPIPEKFEPLLWSDENGDGNFQPQEAIVTRVKDSAFGDKDNNNSNNQVIVVTNGSFVLNYPLVNHEHRKLAGKLIAECPPGAKVAFIESRNAEPTVLDKDPEGAAGGGLFDVAHVWPLNAMVIHLTILGIIYCMAKSPIFGRAKELPGEATADFGRHVTALGQLMARSKDRVYAEQRIAQYQQQGKRKSGKSHLKGS
ncbi:MAG: hypothetical protein ACKVP0_06270 [Pirellulaceae bacterium]